MLNEVFLGLNLGKFSQDWHPWMPTYGEACMAGSWFAATQDDRDPKLLNDILTEGNLSGSALRIFLGLRLYFTVYLSSRNNTDTVDAGKNVQILVQN